MDIRLYQVDAFSDRPFAGNPAAICPLSAWLPDEVMQAIAAENNLSETAFFVPRNGESAADFDLRWFTPTMEADLCGHATLASAFVVFETMEPAADTLVFHSRSGPLAVRRADGLLALDFPALPPKPDGRLGDVAGALGVEPSEVLIAVDGMAVFESEAEVRQLAPDMARVAALDCRGMIATAPGNDCDFVSRFFAPQSGIPEDPVTGSAHCTLIPYWSRRLGKSALLARQVSARGGELHCEDRGERVIIAGRAALYLEGAIAL